MPIMKIPILTNVGSYHKSYKANTLYTHGSNDEILSSMSLILSLILSSGHDLES